MGRSIVYFWSLHNQQTNPNQFVMSEIPAGAADIIKHLPNRLKTDKVGDQEGNFHWIVSGERGGEFTVTVKDAKCEVQKGLHGEPGCVIRASDQDFEDVQHGRTNAQMAVMMGKIKISNLGEMLKFMSFFS